MPATPTYNPILHDPATVGTQLATTCRYARYAEIIFQDDASGWQTFSYGKLGEVTENIRTFAPPFENQTYTFSMYFEYDSWNRIKSMTYPDGTAVQHLHYLPWGEDFVDQRSTNWNTMYTFSAKEKDTETGYSYFGSRYYGSDLSIWLSVDPMADKYPSLSPYTYCANNPVRLVDPNGLYPKSILNYNPSLGLHGGYKLKQSAAHLLSLVSGVSQGLIESTVIQRRAAGQYRPLYSCNSGGGAITVGTRSYTTITFTENWFEDNPNKYEGNGYGLDVMSWLDLLSHEVGHLP